MTRLNAWSFYLVWPDEIELDFCEAKGSSAKRSEEIKAPKVFLFQASGEAKHSEALSLR
jgi:hypothetical protein